jgi:hypothetical protein
LSGRSSTNEYAYTVSTQAAITVTGFKLFTAATGTVPATVSAHIYRATSAGTPEAQPVAAGQLAVGVSPGFYSVILNTPVAIAANTTFFIASDTSTVLVSTLTSGTAGSGFWRRPPRGGSWAASTVVQFPAYEVLCQGGAKPGATPILSSSGVPSLGANFSLRLTLAAPNSPALLMVGGSRNVWGAIPLPMDLRSLGAPGCGLLVSPDLMLQAQTDGSGAVELQFTVPNRMDLVGARFFDQFAVSDPTINNLGLVFSNGGAGKVGR